MSVSCDRPFLVGGREKEDEDDEEEARDKGGRDGWQSKLDSVGLVPLRDIGDTGALSPLADDANDDVRFGQLSQRHNPTVSLPNRLVVVRGGLKGQRRRRGCCCNRGEWFSTEENETWFPWCR